MHTFSFGELALIFGIVVILFGSSRLAKIGKSLGEGIANFKKGLKESDQYMENNIKKERLQELEKNILITKNSRMKSEERLKFYQKRT